MKHPDFERKVIHAHKEVINMGKLISNQNQINRSSKYKQVHDIIVE